MTTGQLVFCSGVGLLIVTLILIAVFALKKPRYAPQGAAYSGPGADQKSHPVAPDRREIRPESRTLTLSDETEWLPDKPETH